MIRRSILASENGGSGILAVLALAMLATSCGGTEGDAPRSEAQPEPPQGIRITVTDESYEMPGELESEPVSLTLQNEGKQVHRAYFARLNQGVTTKEVRSALSTSPDELFLLITIAGSMPEIEPGASSENGMLFPEGEYVVIDPEVKGPPPVSFFTVSASGSDVAEPEADYSIEAGDFYFEVPDPSSGEATVEITNVGNQSHEVGIGRKGVRGEETEVTTVFAPAPGGKMWTTVTLEPGDYTLVCFLPDPKTGKTHADLGMKQDFSVE